MIDLSVNEATALFTKAGKGAGLSWGEAQELARAALTKSEAQAEYLDCLETGDIQALKALVSAADQGIESDAPLYQALTSQAPAPSRISLTSNELACLNQLAAKTYVPASEESRLAGAGAGTSDND